MATSPTPAPRPDYPKNVTSRGTIPKPTPTYEKVVENLGTLSKSPADAKRSPQRAAAELAAKKAAAKAKQSMIDKYKSPGTNGFNGTQGFSKKGPWG